MNFTVVLVDDKFYIDDVKVSYRDVVEVPSVIDEMEIYGITSNAFAGKPIKSVKISEGIQYIADYAFEGCNELESVSIPSSVNYIGEYAFAECKYLRTVTFEQKSKLTKLNKGVFANCENLVNLTLPDKLNTIGEWCFFQCKELINVQMPNNVKSINEFAFAKCENLLNVLFEKGAKLKTVKDYAFLDCNQLVLYMPKTFYSAGKGAFENVFEVHLTPGKKVNVEYIRAFKGCDLHK